MAIPATSGYDWQVADTIPDCFPNTISWIHSCFTPILSCKPSLTWVQSVRLDFKVTHHHSAIMFTVQGLLVTAVYLPVCLSTCLSISHWNSFPTDLQAVCLPHSFARCVSVYLHVCRSLCQTDCSYWDRKWVLTIQKLTRCVLWATSLSRHGRSGTFELTLVGKNRAFHKLYVCTTLTLQYCMFIYLRLGVCLYACAYMHASLCKGSRKSQYLSEISAWNHEQSDLSTVMEPDRVSSGFPQQTPPKPQSKSTKK